MALGILVLLSALSISAVAIYYSIAGISSDLCRGRNTYYDYGYCIGGWQARYCRLATQVLEPRLNGGLRTYLAIAVAVLMFITSMGIFGYLSKAHIEQTSASIESVEKINQIETEIG